METRATGQGLLGMGQVLFLQLSNSEQHGVECKAGCLAAEPPVGVQE